MPPNASYRNNRNLDYVLDAADGARGVYNALEEYCSTNDFEQFLKTFGENTNSNNSGIDYIRTAVEKYCYSDDDNKFIQFLEEMDPQSGGIRRNSRGRFRRSTRNRNSRGRFLKRKTRRNRK